ncbi:MAG TPA: Nif3-like dinuclear metal center hexameric protein [Oscillospiraceae bacterium]|nr:Nif3-like dinuclear metal center hexameric protein [Oscillospiraceae bacterium]
MQLNVQTLIKILEELAPKHLALEWDHVGLQLGSMQGTVKKIYVALDVNAEVLAEAVMKGADFIVTHHPFIFKPLTTIRTDQEKGKLIQQALQTGIRIYAAHTNLDIAFGGVNDVLAARLGLQGTQVLRITDQEELLKVVVFVPQRDEHNVRTAMAAAGAGCWGNYSHCSFYTTGTGTFMPQKGSNPYLGEQGQLEKVEEVRLETIIPASLSKRVVRAMLKAHPYEEVAYDLYPLANKGKEYGLGRIGNLQHSLLLSEFCHLVKERLEIPFVRVTGDTDKLISKVAVCGGAGSDLIAAASFAGAEALVTGDLKYHEAQEAQVLGVAVIDAGHDGTERIIVPALCDYLQQQLAAAGYHIEIIASSIDTTLWNLF